MMYLPTLLVCFFLGFVSLKRMLKTNAIQGPLLICLSTSLGLGLCGLITFFIHLVFGCHLPWAPVTTAIVLGMLLAWPNRKKIFNNVINWQAQMPAFIFLSVLAIFLLLEANYYPMGGWDAWSCWNLKAKFIYLAQENWKIIFDPLLWRSNTQYPLLLPLINVFFYDTCGFGNWIGMVNSVVFTLLSAGTLIFALQAFVNNWRVPLAISGMIFFNPFVVTLSISQYSDVLLGLFLLAACVAYLNKELLLTAVFLGLLSFTKTEGTVAAGILLVLMAFKLKKNLITFLGAFAASASAAIIFLFTMAPHNEAFINGLVSSTKPSTAERLQFILIYPWIEIVSIKWMGVWVILAAALAFFWKKAFHRPLRIFALFYLAYLGILFAYYQVNTFFDIAWWMQNTLNRFIFALLATIGLWAGLSFKKDV